MPEQGLIDRPRMHDLIHYRPDCIIPNVLAVEMYSEISTNSTIYKHRRPQNNMYKYRV